MRYVNILFHLLILSFCLSSAFANTTNIKINGTNPGFVQFDKPVIVHHGGKIQIITGQPIQYMHVTLSPEAQAWLEQHISDPYIPDTSNLPAQISIGMNGVPALNQGNHGTCVTFAVTGGIDAVIGHTDYISQLCNLSLGKFFNKTNPNYPSGWDGSNGVSVLKQTKIYGAVSMQSQKNDGCAGVYKYPKNNTSSTGNAMSTDQFKLHSEEVMKHISWLSILNMKDALSTRMKGLNLLPNIKTALNRGNRVTFAFLLDDDRGNNGAKGKFRKSNDSWIMTPAIEDDAKNRKIKSAHEVLITGYDDNAVISGPDNTYHRGAITIRNQWGKNAGDRGDYYMSYDYLTKMTIEAFEIYPI